MLIFLKELLSEASEYYTDSPNIFVTPTLMGGDWVYNLFTQDLVYKSYVQSKEKYIRHVSKVDDKWTDQILEFFEKQKKSKLFDFGWVVKNITFNKKDDKESALNFLIYLQVIGFLRVVKKNPDIKHRSYELPVLYKSAKSAM